MATSVAPARLSNPPFSARASETTPGQRSPCASTGSRASARSVSATCVLPRDRRGPGVSGGKAGGALSGYSRCCGGTLGGWGGVGWGIEVERGRAKVAAARRAPAGWAAAGPHTCSSDRGFLPAPTPRSPAAPPRSRRAASCARASRPRYTARNPSPAAAAARASSETPGAPRSRAAHVERSAWDRSAQGA